MAATDGAFQIFVKTLAGRSIVVWVHNKSTVADLKYEVQKMEGISAEDQRLQYGGKELRDLHMNLQEFGIKELSEVFLVGRLKGGN